MSVVIQALALALALVHVAIEHLCIDVLVGCVWLWNLDMTVCANSRARASCAALPAIHVCFHLCLCAVASERGRTGELASGYGGDDAWDRWGGDDVLPLNVFILGLKFVFNLDIFLEVCKTAAERAGKGRIVLLEEWADTFVVESM